jgi:uncharacterized protein (TIGR02266 family)
MTYSGATQARTAREALGKALEALQQDPNIPDDVLAVAQNIAMAVGALFEAERASSEPDGKASVKSALGSLSQTLALLQDVRGNHQGIALATETIARSMSQLYPLTTVPSKAPSARPSAAAHAPVAVPPTARIPLEATAPLSPQEQQAAARASAPAAAASAAASGAPRQQVEANIGATTESNFYVGFSGEIGEGGVFLATYETFARGTPIQMLVTLPGGFEMRVNGHVRFVRDPLDFSADSEPGMGIQFESLPGESRELILRFIRKRAPIFYDD